MATVELTPIVLFPGVGANDGLFRQRKAFPQLIVPEWLIPKKHESIAAYSERFANELRSHGPCLIGGVSFGGLIAQEVARHLTPSAVVLISCVRTDELPARICFYRSLRFLIRLVPIRALQLFVIPATSDLFKKIFPSLSGWARWFYRSDPRLLKWSYQHFLARPSTMDLNCPVFQIHGDRDLLLPSRLTQPDRIIPGGGHLIVKTHAKEVNDYIRQILEKIKSEEVIACNPSQNVSRPTD